MRDLILVKAYMTDVETSISETVQRVPVFSLLSNVGGQLGVLRCDRKRYSALRRPLDGRVTYNNTAAVVLLYDIAMPSSQ